MINLKTGQRTNKFSGHCFWHGEDGFSWEGAMGYTTVSADYDVRCKFAKFLRNSVASPENSDIDFTFQGYEYRLAISEDYSEEGPIDVIMIVGPTLTIFELDKEVFIPLAEYLEER